MPKQESYTDPNEVIRKENERKHENDTRWRQNDGSRR